MSRFSHRSQEMLSNFANEFFDIYHGLGVRNRSQSRLLCISNNTSVVYFRNIQYRCNKIIVIPICLFIYMAVSVTVRRNKVLLIQHRILNRVNIIRQYACRHWEIRNNSYGKKWYKRPLIWEYLWNLGTKPLLLFCIKFAIYRSFKLMLVASIAKVFSSTKIHRNPFNRFEVYFFTQRISSVRNFTIRNLAILNIPLIKSLWLCFKNKLDYGIMFTN